MSAEEKRVEELSKTSSANLLNVAQDELLKVFVFVFAFVFVFVFVFAKNFHRQFFYRCSGSAKVFLQ